MNIPQKLYYATILYADGSQQTPPYFVFEKLPEGTSMLRRYFQEEEHNVTSMIIKELVFIESKVVPEDAQVLLPHTDEIFIEETPSQNHDEPSESIMAILPEEQQGNDLLCRAFYMGPFRKAASAEDFIAQLVEEPFLVTIPVDYVWLYRPTGHMKAVNLR